MSELTIQDTKDVWVVYTNTDLTEGRGYNYPLHVCESEATALRLARKAYVQGSDAPVYKETAVRISGRWLAAIQIQPTTQADRLESQRLAAKAAALAKLEVAGLTEYDLQLLGLR